MIREEAVAVFKAFMDNPLFSDIHRAAFNIAIHDIKQRHEWDINNLMLVPKTEWEQEPILDKIRAEIVKKHLSIVEKNGFDSGRTYGYEEVLDIIDKYKAETEET